MILFSKYNLLSRFSHRSLRIPCTRISLNFDWSRTANYPFISPSSTQRCDWAEGVMGITRTLRVIPSLVLCPPLHSPLTSLEQVAFLGVAIWLNSVLCLVCVFVYPLTPDCVARFLTFSRWSLGSQALYINRYVATIPPRERAASRIASIVTSSGSM